MSDNKAAYEELKDLYYFSDLYDFIRESTGIAITLAYLILILSSMVYLQLLYSQFDISIIKLVTLEDILATPIKNPYIILLFITITFILYMFDIGNRFNARFNLKYVDTKPPFYIRLLRIIFWVPKSRKFNLRLTTTMVLFFLGLFITIFADREARNIKRGNGNIVEITTSNAAESQTVTLLGTTSQYLVVYDLSTEQATAYQNESIYRFSPISQKPEDLPD